MVNLNARNICSISFSGPHFSKNVPTYLLVYSVMYFVIYGFVNNKNNVIITSILLLHKNIIITHMEEIIFLYNKEAFIKWKSKKKYTNTYIYIHIYL